MAWRKTLRSLHRDIGYLAVGLTITYAISGIAVDHIDEWNPNRSVSWSELSLGPVAGDTSEAIVAEVVTRLDLETDGVRSHLMQGPKNLKIFMKIGDEITLDPTTGKGGMKVVRDRPVLREANALHLNRPEGCLDLDRRHLRPLAYLLGDQRVDYAQGQSGVRWTRQVAGRRWDADPDHRVDRRELLIPRDR